jgi:hypothetical protein
MATRSRLRARRLNGWAALVLGLFLLGGGVSSRAAGVTVITHGFNGNVTDWVIPMANKIPQYGSFPGSSNTIYKISVTQSGQNYVLTPTLISGSNPLSSDSGEIIIALDWSSLSGLFQASTTTIATQTATALLSTNLIAALGGHPLAELPLHLVGHSRGASVMAELARILGAQGVWVDQLTTLDPYPLSLNGDPAMQLYANVLFADNDWQNTDSTHGQALTGAYNRFLANLSGGYANTNTSAAPYHSNVHLWYHGTVDLATPTTDTQANLTSAERAAWWTAIEAAGTNAGFLYSLIGGGNRLSSLEPAGAGNGRISDGFNKQWDLGAGQSANRVALPADNATWPNLIRLNLATTNPLPAGQPVSLSFYYQFGASTAATATAHFCLGSSPNPYLANTVELAPLALAGTGTTNVGYRSLSLATDPSLILPGTYFVWARLTDGVHSRYLGAPQKLVVTPSLAPPVLAVTPAQTAGAVALTISGDPHQTVVVEASTNLAQWTPVLTNTMTAAPLTWVDPASASLPQRFYRAHLDP